MITKESDRQTQMEALLKNNVSGIAMLDNGTHPSSLFGNASAFSLGSLRWDALVGHLAFYSDFFFFFW